MYIIRRCLLRERCEQAGITQKQLAERLQLSPQLINDYAQMRAILGLEYARIISEILHCSIVDLYEWDDVPLSEQRKQRRSRRV